MNKRVWFRDLAVVASVCFIGPLHAQNLNVDGMWRGKTSCPSGPVAFSLVIKGVDGRFTYGPESSKKTPAEGIAVKMSTRAQDMNVSLYAPGLDAEGVTFGGDLLADGSVNVSNPKFGTEYCDSFRMMNAATKQLESKIPFDAQGLDYEPFMTKIMRGDFSAVGLPADDPRFNDLFGSYLYAYSEQCAANASSRPANFVEMTNLQCVEEGITTTYYRNGTFSQSAAYCTRWKDVPSGYYADPALWEVKKTLDERFLRDTYKNLFSALKGPDLAYRGSALPDFKKMA